MTAHIHVRPLEIGDFEFVQSLASRQPNFTVPPTYVLWLMLRLKGAICLIAEHSTQGPLAYLLAVPVEGPAESIFVWQLAALEGRQQQHGTVALLTELRSIVVDRSIEMVSFSSVPNSAGYRAIRRYARRIASLVPTPLNNLPASVSPNEKEFLLSLGVAYRVVRSSD